MAAALLPLDSVALRTSREGPGRMDATLSWTQLPGQVTPYT